MPSTMKKIQTASQQVPAIMKELQACKNVALRAKKLYKTKGGSLGKLHAGGRVNKTGNFRLKKGEIILNKTQQAKLHNAKTTKAKNKVIADVKKLKPKKMKKRK